MPWSNQGGGPWGSGGGGGKGPWGSGPQPSGPTPPDLEEFLRRSQDKLRTVLPGGNLGGKGLGLIVLAAVAIWGFSGFFRVEPDELGVVLRFGKYVREAQPGLNYHLPYPIETVLTPKALRVNKIDVGMRVVEDLRRGSTVRDVPEESLMLTGDENIVDVDFSVLWRIKPNGVGDYLFNIQQPEGTVKAVAESAMREVVGRSNIQPILTGARQNIETGVQELMQKTLDDYGAGIQITQVQLQKVDPPSQVIDAFRDVQAARADLERAQNEAQTYANRVVPEARGRAAQIIQAAEAYREQTVAEAKGQTARFLKVYDEYKKAPDVTRQRMYLETMERLFGGTDKIIMDSGAQRRRRALSAARPAHAAPPPPQRRRREAADETQSRRRRPRRRSSSWSLIVAYGSLFTVYQTRQALVVRLGQPVRVVTEPGLQFQDPADRQRHPHRQAHPRSREPGAGSDRLRPEAARGRCLRALPHHRPLQFYQTVGTVEGANSQLSILLNSALRRVLGEATLTQVVRDQREQLMARVREQLDNEAQAFGIYIVDVRIRRADLPEQNSQAVYQRMKTERQREAAEFRAQGSQRAQEIRAKADRDVTVLLAEAHSRKASRPAARAMASATASSPRPSARDPEFFAFYRSMQAYEAGLRPTTRACCSSPIRSSSAIFVDPSGKAREGGRAGDRGTPAAPAPR